ncbi:MAG: hypothetical protein H0V17_16800 [Deltaproteobacteria bacterium]|nr:hypothetical protein [Deltaproteobacteria bacterium]
MASLRQILFALAIPAALVACGGSDDGLTPPTGPHFGFVVDSADVPNKADSLDLNPEEDNGNDNQLGQVLTTLGGQGFDIQGTLDEAIQQGTIVLLLDFQSPNFDSTTGAGLRIKLGDMPNPAPCTDPLNPTPATCGKHLAGGATFTLSASSPADAGVDGRIVGGVFTGGPGNIPLEIALAGSEPISLNLIGARAKATGLSESSLGEVILAGGITETELDGTILPAIQAQLPGLIDEDCDVAAGPPTCGCTDGSTGETVITLFDTSPKDCMVTVEEIKTNNLVQTLLAPDLIGFGPNGEDAVSLALRVTTVSASFPGID